MKHSLMWFLFAVQLFPLVSWSAQNMTASIYQKSFIWDRPGYSYKDCRPLENDDKAYKDLDDLALTEQRFSNGGKEACEGRRKDHLLTAGEEVDVLVDDKGEPISKSGQVIISGELENKRFYNVQWKSPKGEIIKGWISEDQLTKIVPKELPEEKVKQKAREKTEPPCPPGTKRPNSADSIVRETQELKNYIENKLDLGPTKSNAEVDQFACLHRQGSIQDIKRFQKPALDAAKSFGIPYGMIMCTMLVESGFKHRPDEKDEYRGYGQFGSALVEDLSKKAGKSPFLEMWSSFKSKNHDAALTDANIRRRDDPKSVSAAVALALRWMYDERLPAVGCKDCSTNRRFNRKDLYMLVAGYNYSPYSLNKLVKRSPASLRNGFPPPDETRHYMTQMDRCLAKDNKLTFRERNAGANSLAESRKEECAAAFPTK